MGFAILPQLRQQMYNAVPRGGGSVPGKAPNENRQRDAGALLLYSDYFADNTINTPKKFCRRFRMNKDLFKKIVHSVREYDDYFKYKKDYTGETVRRLRGFGTREPETPVLIGRILRG
jgi:hypothetical protein